LTSIAYAMGQGGGNAAQGAAGGFASFIPLILMFVIFYFLLIRPQQKKSKEHREMLNTLKKGDRIVTSGGLHGRITAVSEAVLTVEIADKVRVKLNRGNVAALLAAAAAAPAEKEEKPAPESKAD
jgi:preprotein translocase subunit YajC